MEDALATMNVPRPDDSSRSAEEFFPVICPDFLCINGKTDSSDVFL
jgi:hypothetical protein